MIKNPNDIIEKLTSDYLNVFGNDLTGAYFYGSVVSHEYCPGVSQITSLLLLTDISICSIRRYEVVHETWSKHNVVFPLFMSESSLKSFCQLFPVRFLDIQSCYRTIYGDDFIGTLQIEQEYLRIDCLKAFYEIISEIRNEFLMYNGKRRDLQGLLDFKIKGMFPLFKALLVLHGRKIPYASSEIVSSVEDLFGLGASVISDVLYNGRLFKGEYGDLYDRLISVVNLFSDCVDRLVCTCKAITIDQHDFRK